MIYTYAVTPHQSKDVPPHSEWRDTNDCDSTEEAVLFAAQLEIRRDCSNRKFDVWTAPANANRGNTGLPFVVHVHSVELNGHRKVEVPSEVEFIPV